MKRSWPWLSAAPLWVENLRIPHGLIESRWLADPRRRCDVP